MVDPTAVSSEPSGRAPGRHWRIDLLSYVAIGVLSIGIDVGLLVVLHQVLRVELGLATTAAFVASLLFNFFLNRHWMSGGGRQGMGGHAVRFMILVTVNYVVTLVVVTSAGTFGISYLVAKLVVVAASTGWNFLLYRHWIFATPRQPPRPAAASGGAS
ncbi:MAG: GtrA family protein [Actinomycetota bacterium]|nr:GtrA family protein [Actinomycetota bacterium]